MKYGQLVLIANNGKKTVTMAQTPRISGLPRKIPLGGEREAG